MIAVVGGGFWGAATARRLSQAGHSVTVYDDGSPDGASRAAAGICKTSWYRQGTVRKMTDGVFTYGDFMIGFDWLRQEVPIRFVPEVFVNYSRGTWSVKDDNYLGDPGDLLRLPPDIRRVASRVETVQPRSGGALVTGAGFDDEVDAVVVAAGAATDDILSRSGLGCPTGVKPLPGRAVYFDMPDTQSVEECVTVMLRPYMHYTFRTFRGGIRGGDTVERGGDRMSPLKALARDMYPDAGDMTVRGGIRPVCLRMFVGEVTPGVYAATGGHRVGFGLSGAVALRLESLLGG